MSLAELLERNRTFLLGRTPQPLPPPESTSQLVVACYDPRLDGLLRGALGLDEGRAFVIRTAGAAVTPASDPLRSIALAVYLFGVQSIFVIGHTNCRMATFDTARFIEAFRARGVLRDAFGADDLRAWARASPDPKRGVQASIAALRGAACLPRDLEISGLILDDASGALEVVVRPGETLPGATVQASAEVEALREVQESEVAEAKGVRGAPEPPRAEPARAPTHAPSAVPELTKVLAAAGSFVQTVAAHATWRHELEMLRAELHTERNPVTRVRRIDAFVRKTVADSREVAAAFERLRHEAQRTDVHLDESLLLELLRRAIMGEKP